MKFGKDFLKPNLHQSYKGLINGFGNKYKKFNKITAQKNVKISRFRVFKSTKLISNALINFFSNRISL